MKLTVYIHVKKESWEHDFSYHAFSQDMTEMGYSLICSRDVYFDTPDTASITKGLVTALRKKQQTIRAESQAKIIEIDDEIGKLLALSAPEESK